MSKLNKGEKDKTLEQVLLDIEKQFGKGAIMKLGEEGLKDIDVVSSGSLALDIALGVGGYPKGRIIEIYGPESSGKTTFALHAIAEVQKTGGRAAFIDAEHALDPVYAKKLGVNINELLLSQPDTGEQALEICEALVRSGIGAFDLIDDDKVCLTNLNRQIIATRKTVGKYKTEVMKERMLEINPNVDVRIHNCFFLPENADEFPFDEYDYIIDAVDTVTAKISIIMKANELGIPVISSMGAGNKLDPTAFRVADIYKTRVCPLAKVMRRELKKRGVKKLKVVYSEEQPTRPIEDMSISCRTNCICPPGAEHKCTERRDIPGSVAFVPSVVGLIIAGEVIKDIAGVNAK